MKIDKWFHLYGRKDDIVFEEVPFENLPSAQQWIPKERLVEQLQHLNRFNNNECPEWVFKVIEGM